MQSFLGRMVPKKKRLFGLQMIGCKLDGMSFGVYCFGLRLRDTLERREHGRNALRTMVWSRM